MTTRRKWFTATVILIAAGFTTLFLLFALNPSDRSAEAAPRYEIQVILKARSNPPDFWRIVEQGISLAADECNVEVEVNGPTNERDIDAQIALVEAAIEKKPQLIILAACDRERLTAVCRRVTEAGIRLITLDSDVNYDGVECFVGTNNYELGRNLGQQVNAAIGTEAPFGVIGHVAASTTAAERLAGLMDAVADAKNRCRDVQYCNSDMELAKQQTLAMLRAHPDIRCMVGLNESSALGISHALEELELGGKVLLVACDSSTEQIRYMEKGTIQCFVIQYPINMGYMAIKLGVDLLDGKPIPDNYDTGTKVITPDELYKPENQQFLFPFVN